MLALLVAALASNVYLAHLYVRVNRSAGHPVDSFCNVNPTVNCANVAATHYSSFLNVPVAIYGAEFYGLVTLVVLLSAARLWSLRAWDSLLFWAMLLALPISAVMAYISAFVIGMLCPLCSVVYGANLLVLLILLAARRHALRELLCAGPRELRQALSSSPIRAAIALLLVLSVSQFFWVPPLMGQPRVAGHVAPGQQEQAKSYPRGGLTVGSPGAPVQIFEFSDFQCSVCSRAHDAIAELLVELQGQVYFRHFDFPLDQACNRVVTQPFHENACRAAYYARCADEQRLFWPFIKQLYTHQDALARSDLEGYSKKVGLDATRLATCLRRAETRQAVLGDIEEGIRRGVRGTPTFFVNGEEIVGPRDLAFWRSKVASLRR